MGKFAKLALLVLACFVTILLCAACDPPQKKREFHANAKQYHLKDGRYAMQADDGWYWYWITQNNTTTYYTSARAAVVGPAPSPTGGAWVKGNPPTEEETEQAQIDPVETVETSSGQIEAVEAGEIGMDPAPAADAGASTSDSSGGGDSGGGGGAE